jgi:hypothetical protein
MTRQVRTKNKPFRGPHFVFSSSSGRITPVSSTVTGKPCNTGGICFIKSGVFFTTMTIMQGLPPHSPIAVPTTPGVDMSLSVFCLRTSSMVALATRFSCCLLLPIFGPQFVNVIVSANSVVSTADNRELVLNPPQIGRRVFVSGSDRLR